MCGIVGYVGPREALPIIMSGLSKLEYRGYDSAGVAVAAGNGALFVARATGKLAELQKVLSTRSDLPQYIQGKLQAGIGHTRWATHGRPAENNAHPHSAGRVSLIHNGIIENYLELRERLSKSGSIFKSETDTEIAAHLLNHYLSQGLEPFEALKAMCADIKGSYAFVAIDAHHPERLLVAKNATPIIIGLGEGENIVASDIPAVLESTRNIVVLEDGDLAEVTAQSIRIENEGRPVERKRIVVTWDPVTAQKGGYKHFMLKEIHEQTQVLADTFRGRIALEQPGVVLPEVTLTTEQIKNLSRVILLGCGTAWHACLVAKFFIEQYARIPCEVDYASEFRYRPGLYDERTLVVAVSQSGETLDTLAAMETVIKAGRSGSAAPTLAVCNVVGSSLARRVGNVMLTHAGPEISVASTKAFTTQLVSVLLLAVHLGQTRGITGPDEARSILDALLKLPGAVEEAINTGTEVERIGKKFHTASDFLFLGRSLCYPIALEGALKLKEISYIHAEGYPAGEMKHGPIALIDEQMPVVMILQRSKQIYEKTISNLKEVEARGARIIVVTDLEPRAGHGVEGLTNDRVFVPFLHDALSPLLLTIPLQLLSYYVAVLNGTDVDLPRNLAKSVTVE